MPTYYKHWSFSKLQQGRSSRTICVPSGTASGDCCSSHNHAVGQGRTSATQALEAIEALSELRRVAAAMPEKDKSPSFNQSVTLLESQFREAWQAYVDGRFWEAKEIATKAYEEFR